MCEKKWEAITTYRQEEIYMTRKERVLTALSHRTTDRVPKGETWIDGNLANKLMNTSYPTDFQHFERDKAIREFLNIDLVNAGDWPSSLIGEDKNGYPLYRSIYGYEFIQGVSKHITKPPLEHIEDAKNYVKPDIHNVDPSLVKRFATETDFFVFAQIGGPVSMLDEMFDMEDYMVYCMTNPDEIQIITEKVMEYEIEKAKLFIDNGADAIFFADDIAFNTGTLLPPYVMENLVFPFYNQTVKEIKAYKNVPVVAHSDGDLNSVLHKYVEAGFDGLQSLQPSAGMDIKKIKEEYGDDLCLWGNLDLDYLMSFGTPDEVRKVVRETIDIASHNGGFILSTCNTMIDSIPPENVLAMMEESEK